MEAVADAGLADYAGDRERVGVCIGSGIGGLPMIEETKQHYLEGGLRKISPFFVPGSIINMISGHVSIHYGYQGPNLALVSACTTANHSLGEGARLIEYGDADVMVAGGAEATVSPLGVGGFCAARALSHRNDDPATASRPWDAGRDGFVLGEGAGVLVLEEYEHAKARGARIYCELAGFGMSADAHHITAPPEDGRGAARSMANALKNAQMNLDDIQYINAHGTSTPLGDIAETRGHAALLRRPRRPARGVVDQVDDGSPARRAPAGSRRSSRCSRSATRWRPRRPTSSTATPDATSISCRSLRARWKSAPRCRTRSASAAPTRRWCSARSDAAPGATPTRSTAPAMALIVQKYGGTSVGSTDRIKNVARRVARFHREGHQVVVVVSAMAGETNRLLALAKELSPAPIRASSTWSRPPASR